MVAENSKFPITEINYILKLIQIEVISNCKNISVFAVFWAWLQCIMVLAISTEVDMQYEAFHSIFGACFLQ